MDNELRELARNYKNELIAHLFGQPDSAVNETEEQSILAQIPANSNIIGVGFGHKMTEGNVAQEEPVIRIYVRAKLPIAEIPESLKIPTTINGMTTDVIEIGAIQPYSTPCGVSVSHQSGKPGTIACLVRKTVGGNNADFLLSNNHVLANSNRGRIGDFIVQPGV
ncbi:MAG: hypothetical protein ACRC6M_17230, partial [Microcystaceae cyanobacterium]